MKENQIPAHCLIRDPKTLQPAQVPQKARSIDLDTLGDLLNITASLSETSRMISEYRAIDKLYDIRDEIMSIVSEGVAGAKS